MASPRTVGPTAFPVNRIFEVVVFGLLARLLKTLWRKLGFYTAKDFFLPRGDLVSNIYVKLNLT